MNSVSSRLGKPCYNLILVRILWGLKHVKTNYKICVFAWKKVLISFKTLVHALLVKVVARIPKYYHHDLKWAMELAKWLVSDNPSCTKKDLKGKKKENCRLGAILTRKWISISQYDTVSIKQNSSGNLVDRTTRITTSQKDGFIDLDEWNLVSVDVAYTVVPPQL